MVWFLEKQTGMKNLKWKTEMDILYMYLALILSVAALDWKKK